MPMPKPDPYTVLGVPKNADAETIRQAHRRRARATHPDAGGNAADFRAVNEAAVILRDPGRRARYDETGQTEVKDTAMNDLISLFMRACDALDDQPGDAVKITRKKLANMKAQIEDDQADLQKAAAKWKRMADRVKKAKGPNLLKIALENRSTDLTRKAASASDELERIDRMVELLDGYSFEAQEPITFVPSKVNGNSPHAEMNEMVAEMLRKFGI